ncbi:sulfurtransferase [Ottowia testudinis]|uniref:Sulfurtransferase n=1 Tax=Ottowia testudinis TaxID=2816950 RepID=A0A975CH15_9BURK|nr:rhodanese-like domain-containing protein [Ottowia testudinis]QTD45651.1 sulfurtransferase [Ottowia testudinis]
MRRSISFLITWLAGVLLAAPAWAAPALLTPAELQALRLTGQVRIVDAREAPAYAMQHIPGAVSAPYGRWRGPASNPGQLPPLAALTALVQELGLTPDTHAVIVYTGVDSTDFGAAARVYWTLKSLGATQLSILNGGLNAWKAAGLPVTAQPARASASSWQPSFSPRWLATQDEVRAQLAPPGGAQGAVLVDSRPAPFFQGKKAHGAARAAGTLPGAVNLDSDLFFEPGSAALMDLAQLAAEADGLRSERGRPTVAFCNTGHWAATDWFVLSEVLGRPDVKLYPGSMVDWSQAAAPLPMANEPGRLAQLRTQLMNWSHRNLGTKAP